MSQGTSKTGKSFANDKSKVVLGPGDSTLMKVRNFNTYKQLQYTGQVFGMKPRSAQRKTFKEIEDEEGTIRLPF